MSKSATGGMVRWLVSGIPLLLGGCGAVTVLSETDGGNGGGSVLHELNADGDTSGEPEQMIPEPETLQRALPTSTLVDTAFYTVLTPQVLQPLPGVEVTETWDDDGQVTYMLNNGSSTGSVQCKCSASSSGVCYAAYPQDGSPATCVGECDDAGAICTWISRANPTGLAIDQVFDSVSLGW